MVADPKSSEPLYNVVTDTCLYHISGKRILSKVKHSYKHIPIVEYRLNAARMGVFEPALPLLDAINTIESNRLAGIEQNVQALMKLVSLGSGMDAPSTTSIRIVG